MNKKIIKSILLSIKIFGLLAVILIAISTWHLVQGNLTLGFVTPLAEKMLTPSNSAFKVKFDDAKITLVKDAFPLGIRIHNFKLLDKEKKPVASISDMSISFSLKELLKGNLSPKTTFLYHPYINIRIAQNGNTSIGVTETDNETLDNKSDNISSNFAISPKLFWNIYKNDFKSLLIFNGKLRIQDKKHATVWNCSEFNAKLLKRDDAILVTGNAELLQPKDQISDIVLDAQIDLKSKIATLNFGINNFYLPRGLEKVLLAGTKTSMPLSGKVTATFDLNKKADFDVFRKRIIGIDFSFTGGKGSLIFPKRLKSSYDVKNIALEGYAKDGLTDTQITNLEVQTLIGAMAKGRANVEGLDVIVDENNWDALKIDFNVTGTDIPLDKLKEYWPAILGPLTHDWVINNLSGGILRHSTFNLFFTGNNKSGIDLDKVDGQVDVENTNVKYMETMPIVKNVSGKLFVAKDDVTVKIKKGKSLGLNLYDTELYFYDIWEPQEKTKMKIKVKGSLHDAMTLLDQEPFKFLTEMNINPADIKGSTDITLNLQFPLRKDLNVKQIGITANAKIKDAFLPVNKEYPFEKSNLSLALSNTNMQITGTIHYKKIPVNISWQEVFSGKNQGSTYSLSAIISDEQRSALGLDFYPVSNEELTGNIDVSSTIKIDKNKNTTINLSADLRQAEFDDGYLNITKKAGETGKLTATIKLKNKTLSSIPEFKLQLGNKNLILGHAKADKNGQISQIILNKFITEKTNANITADKAKNGVFKISAQGISFDASELFAFDNDNSANEKRKLLSFDLIGDFDKVWLSDQGYIENLTLNMSMEQGGFAHLTASAETATGKAIKATLTKTGDRNTRNFSIITKDGGALLNAFGYASNIKGGNLTLTAESQDYGYMSGNLVMEDYKLLQAPVLAQLLSIASLGGILDMLKNDGLSFDIAEIPFEVKPSGIYLKDAHASGFSLGLTAQGSIKNGVWDLEGSIIPIYAVNGILGKIPLLGMLFSGGEVGGGLIAFKYYIDGPTNNLILKVNPLSALTPGVTRQVFHDTDQDTGEHDIPTSIKAGNTDKDQTEVETKTQNEIQPDAQTTPRNQQNQENQTIKETTDNQKGQNK